MKIKLENVLIDCLNDTLHIMLCSESSGTICTINSLIDRYPMFNFLKARSSDAMKLYFRQIPTWHCLILDSRCGFSEDFFAVMRELPLWVPIIVLADYLSEDYLRMYSLSADTNNSDDTQNFTFNDNPSDKKTLLLEKRKVIVFPLRSFKNLFPMLQVESIKKKLMQKSMPDGFALEALEVLFAQNPITVEEWSSTLDSTPRKFQRMFKNFTYYSPKKLIALYHAYRIAFETIGRDEEYGKGIISAYVLDERSKKRVLEYVLSRRSQLLSVK